MQHTISGNRQSTEERKAESIRGQMSAYGTLRSTAIQVYPTQSSTTAHPEKNCGMHKYSQHTHRCCITYCTAQQKACVAAVWSKQSKHINGTAVPHQQTALLLLQSVHSTAQDCTIWTSNTPNHLLVHHAEHPQSIPLTQRLHHSLLLFA